MHMYIVGYCFVMHMYIVGYCFVMHMYIVGYCFVMHMCIVGYWRYAFGLISVAMESVVCISCGSIYCRANQE